jgi:hypothetical protein
MTNPSVRRGQAEKRRSSRMALNASIMLMGEDRRKSAFTTSAKATSLNLHGALIRLDRELIVGSTLQVRNQSGTQVRARVVSQLAAFQGLASYAIEFVDTDDKARNFWGIAFPPSGK